MASVFYTDVVGRQTRRADAPLHSRAEVRSCPFCFQVPGRVSATQPAADATCTIVARGMLNSPDKSFVCCWACYKRLNGVEGPTALEQRASTIRFTALMARVKELRTERAVAEQDAINKPGEWFRPSVVPPQAAPEKVIQRVTVNLSNVLDTIRAIRAARLQ